MSEFARFPTTAWHLLHSVKSTNGEDKRSAMEQLASIYWKPVYSYLRGKAATAEDAADLTQNLLVQFCEQRGFERADPERGKFRTFILTSLKNSCADAWRRSHAQKRGSETAAAGCHVEDTRQALAVRDSRPSPELEFDRNWAGAILNHAMAQLKERFAAKGKAGLADHVCAHLVGDPNALSHADAAEKLGLSPADVRQETLRARRYLRQLIVEEIAATVADRKLVEEELRHLFRAWQIS